MFTKPHWIKRVHTHADGTVSIEVEFATAQSGDGTSISPLPAAITLGSTGSTAVSAKPSTPQVNGENTFIGQVILFTGQVQILTDYCKNETYFQRT